MIERRDQGKVILLLLVFIGTPLLISWTYANVSGWAKTTNIAYDVEEKFDSSYGGYVKAGMGNATTTYFVTQTPTFDNDTYQVLITSLDFYDTDSPTGANLKCLMNSTFIDEFYSVIITWHYVGAGNFTCIDLAGTSGGDYKQYRTHPSTEDLGNNGTLTWIPEAFQYEQIKASTEFFVWFKWTDDNSLPADDEYFQFTIRFTESTMILTQGQILNVLALGAGIMFFIGGASISAFWNPMSGYRRR